MKDALGGIGIIQIVVVFVLLFTGIICLTINQSKAFGVKDEIINIIQNSKVTDDYELSDDTESNIINHLKKAGYRTTGNCPDEEWIGYSREGVKVNNNATFCVKPNDVSKSFYEDVEDKCSNDTCYVLTNDDYPKMVYYEVALFYELDIPIINYFMNFKTYGSTKLLFG